MYQSIESVAKESREIHATAVNVGGTIRYKEDEGVVISRVATPVGKCGRHNFLFRLDTGTTLCVYPADVVWRLREGDARLVKASMAANTSSFLEEVKRATLKGIQQKDAELNERLESIKQEIMEAANAGKTEAYLKGIRFPQGVAESLRAMGFKVIEKDWMNETNIKVCWTLDP